MSEQNLPGSFGNEEKVGMIANPIFTLRDADELNPCLSAMKKVNDFIREYKIPEYNQFSIGDIAYLLGPKEAYWFMQIFNKCEHLLNSRMERKIARPIISFYKNLYNPEKTSRDSYVKEALYYIDKWIDYEIENIEDLPIDLPLTFRSPLFYILGRLHIKDYRTLWYFITEVKRSFIKNEDHLFSSEVEKRLKESYKKLLEDIIEHFPLHLFEIPSYREHSDEYLAKLEEKENRAWYK